MVQVSVVIPVLSDQKFTSQCIDSIKKSTDPSQYEIIVIDNGSNAETAQFLKSLEGVKVVTNEVNEGFAKAINKGWSVAKGDYLFMLNNDTVLYPNWLPRMVSAFDEHTGAVGPVSNYVMGRQRIPAAGRASPEQLQKYVSVQNRGKMLEAEFLIGFALMVSRKTIEKIGLLDERFFAGSEDLDYSLRLRRNGLKLKIAQDVYIHHFGSVTSVGILNKSEEYYEQCNKLFFEKWSKELNTSITSHRQAFEVSFGVKQPELTITTIVKNECGLIQNMIKTTSAFCSDFCIVDTGSVDETVPTLQRLLLNNGLVLQYDWNDNFSEARNLGLQEARGKWLLQLDADEVIDKQFASTMVQLIQQDNFDAIRFKIINFRECPFLVAHPKKDVLTSIRMWKNNDKIRYDGMIHETVSDSIVKAGYRVGEAPIPIYHFAYLNKPSSERFKLMKLAASKEPTRSNNHYFLGEEYLRRGALVLATNCFINAMACGTIKGNMEYSNKVQQMLDITKAVAEGRDINGFPRDVQQHFGLLYKQLVEE